MAYEDFQQNALVTRYDDIYLVAGARTPRGEPFAARAVPHDRQRGARLRRPLLLPRPHGQQDRPYAAATRGQHVFVSHRPGRVLDPLEQAELADRIGDVDVGARIALLNRSARDEIARVVKQVEKIETAVEAKFQEHFSNPVHLPVRVISKKLPGRCRILFVDPECLRLSLLLPVKYLRLERIPHRTHICRNIPELKNFFRHFDS